MTKHIPEFDEIHGPAGRSLTDYVDENIPALWAAVPETIQDIANTGTHYTGTIEDWGPASSIDYYPPFKLLWFTPHVPNGAASQLSISGLPSIPITTADDSTPAPSGSLLAGQPYLLRVASDGLSIAALELSGTGEGSGLATLSVTIPTTGFNLTIPTSTEIYILEPAGTLASGTLTLPSLPGDGFQQTITSTQIITLFTLSPTSGDTLIGTFSTLSANSPIRLVYKLSSRKWYRI